MMLCADDQIRGTLLTVLVALPSRVSDSEIAEIASLLEDQAISTSWERTQNKDWSLLWLVDFKPSAKVLAAQIGKKIGLEVLPTNITIAPVPDVNWLEESYKQFPPFAVGPFFIYGSHFEGSVPKGKLPLLIDAATAFGSGEHGTTKGCLEALAKLEGEGVKPKHILDMGTGSGILAIAAYRLWKKPTLAIDNDREATRVAVRHRRMNAVPAGEKGMSCATGDGYQARQVKQAKKFDLIIANILAGPLTIMAPSLAANLAKGGVAILSGLLTTQEADVLAAHKAVGLKKKARIVHEDWCTLILEQQTVITDKS